MRRPFLLSLGGLAVGFPTVIPVLGQSETKSKPYAAEPSGLTHGLAE